MGKKYDVVIVGAGPAGLMAAKTAGENGLEAVLLERKTNITKTTRVDGGAVGINEYLFGQMLIYNQRDKRLCFPVAGFSIPYHGPITNLYGFQLHSPGGHRIFFGDWTEARRKGDAARVGIALSKEKLMTELLQEVQTHQVKILPGANVCGIKKTGDTVQIASNKGEFEAPFIIAADGVNSRIARIMGFNKERKFTGTWRGLSWIMQGEIPIDVGSFNFILTEKATFDVIPTEREDLYHVGTFSFKNTLDLNALLEQFTQEDRTYAAWFKKAKKIAIVNAVVNELSPVKEPFRDNVLLIGDAAWLREFSNMAAICAGWKAANAVTLALLNNKINKEGITSYLEWWEQYFYGPYGEAEFGAGELQDFLTGEEIDYLASLVAKPLPATLNFFTLYEQIGSTYAELLTKIDEERPEIMAKLFDMRSKFEELWEDQSKMGFANK